MLKFPSLYYYQKNMNFIKWFIFQQFLSVMEIFFNLNDSPLFLDWPPLLKEDSSSSCTLSEYITHYSVCCQCSVGAIREGDNDKMLQDTKLIKSARGHFHQTRKGCYCLAGAPASELTHPRSFPKLRLSTICLPPPIVPVLSKRGEK